MLYNLSFQHKVPENSLVIDVTSNSKSNGKWFSPFYVGPCAVYDGYEATSIENLYQFTKVYAEFQDINGEPTEEYWKWATSGWSNPKPIKHPVGAWRQHSYYLWKGRKLDRLQAQNEIFVPNYCQLIVKTEAYKRLKSLYQKTNKNIVLLDYEGYNFRELDMTYKDVINHSEFPIGQGFCLLMLLDGFLNYELCK